MSRKKETVGASDIDAGSPPLRAEIDAVSKDSSLEVVVHMGGRRETVLVHEGARSRLRITAGDKLILTKQGVPCARSSPDASS